MRLFSFTLVAVAVAALAVLLVTSEDGEDRPSASGNAARDRLQVSTDGWMTDFSRHTVPLGEFISGGPGKDGIPAIDEPKFVPVREADRFLADREPVLVVELDGRTRVYPVQILLWHEIVNDEVAGTPIAVTYCPLCNSSLVFDRRVEGRTLDFGTTGNLRHSDLVMYDRQTETWWQQLTGEAVVGRLTGKELTALASQTLSFSDVKRLHPHADVLSRDTGFPRDYGRNPYQAYDSDPDEQPFLLDQEADRRLSPKERVVAVQGKEQAVVVPFTVLRRKPAIATEVDGRPVLVLFAPGVASALDAAQISDSRDVGAVGVFDARLDGRPVALEPAGRGRWRDARTNSLWDVTGRAISGPLAGRRLRPVTHDAQFWFAVAAFLPDVKIVSGS